ncbi:MAG: ferrous iron transporter B [Planctomycetes bacterium]|nr:ferrous iron transporter B [Planctomycetota bacterium]MBM4078262.1 ferrous iron transporter B [Planctomycetota bacterium]
MHRHQHRHGHQGHVPVTTGRKIVLAGNPNVGKSVFFNHFSGLYVDVSNYPGTTIEVTTGRMGDDTIMDTPGIYGVSSFNDEERVARDIVLQADVIINVVDAVHLERDLFLTQQLIDMGKPLVVALNFMDEAAIEGIEVDADLLSDMLGVPVVPTVAVTGKGFAELEQALPNAAKGLQGKEMHRRLHEMLKEIGSQPEALMILEGDPIIAARHGVEPGKDREEIYIARRERVNDIVKHCVREVSAGSHLRAHVGRWVLQPLTGIPILIVMLFLVYELIAVLIAQKVVNFTEIELMKGHWEPAVQRLVARVSKPESITKEPTPRLLARLETLATEATEELGDALEETISPAGLAGWAPAGLVEKLSPELRAKLSPVALTAISDPANYLDRYHFKSAVAYVLAGEFGVFTHTVRYLLGLLLPLVIGFYLALAILEDSGYLPRLATMMDRLFNAVGLNGRAVIPVILGFGCVTMATITTRLLRTEREKTITAAILNLVIPCSAQLGVIAGLLAVTGSATCMALYVAVIVLCLIIIGTLLDRVLPGQSSALLIDLPPMRLPRPDNVFRKTLVRTYNFIREAFPWFVFGSLLVATMQVTGILNVWQAALRPLTVKWLQLPPETATAFVMGMVRRDFGAAGLNDLARSGAMSGLQIVISLIVITLFVPCIASTVILIKERGAKEGLTIWVGTWVVAFLVGGIVSQIFI